MSLQIYVYGEIQSGFLELFPGTVLEMEELLQQFNEDMTADEFSLPLDFPWTEHNRRILGFPERIENYNRKEWFWKIDVINNGFPELSHAKLTMLGKAGSFNYRKGRFTGSVSGTKGLFGSAIKNKKLTDLNLGGIIEWAGMDSRAFAYSHATGGQPAYPQICFTPVAIEKFFKEDRSDFDGEFIAKATVNNVVVTGPGTNDWIFGRPDPDNPNIIVPSGSEGYRDFRTVPFYYVQYVYRKCFEEFGYTIAGDFLDDPAFAELLLFNNYALEYYAPTIQVDYNRKIVPKNHVPDVTISDFIKSIFSAFSLFPSFLNNNEVRLTLHTTDLATKKITSLDRYVVSDFSSEYLDGNENEKGYTLKYLWDSADSYFSERVKDLSNKTKIGTVATRGDLVTVDPGRPLTTDDIVLVEADNMWYQVADGTVIPVLWDAYSENLDDYIDGAGQKSIEVNLSTLCAYVVFNDNTSTYEKLNLVACRQLGSYINNRGALVKNPFGVRIFYGKKQIINGVNVPTSFNHNRNTSNQKIVAYSLSWNAADGLAKLHIQWQSILQNAEVVKLDVMASEKVKKILKDFNRFQIAGTTFFLKGIERSIPSVDVFKLQLVPL